MKMFRPALAGALPAFVLLVCIQLNARVKVAAPSQSRQLLFEDRVAYQRAIEEVYWRHRIWPKNRPDRKPSLDAVMSQATIEQKVQDYLRHSELLEQDWSKPITPEQLQTEMERMAQHTKQPEVLRELFAALGNDPFVIAECLARPVLSERFANGDPVAAEPALSASRTGVPPAHPVETELPMTIAAVNRTYTLPVIVNPSGTCIDDTWTATSTTNAPSGRSVHSAVWTGSEMIVWGGCSDDSNCANALNTGGRYNPSTDSWTATSTTNAPAARGYHTAVWTGSEMIVWGGFDGLNRLNTGGRYNPGTDSWTATSGTNAPTARSQHTAVWTGSEMIVWGGDDSSNFYNTGGRYNPNTNSWTATTTTNAPTGRTAHAAVWTGSEMIVWGGLRCDPFCSAVNTGGRYNPSTDSWRATTTTNAPTGRIVSTAVWTDSEMIVWGGCSDPGCANVLNTGGRYIAGANSWTSTNTTNAPTARWGHTAVWTGSEMIVWGGCSENPCRNPLRTGGRYNPSTDEWRPTSTTNAPTGRYYHTAVWTGSEMIVWGGLGEHFVLFNTGGRYCAQAGSPTPTPTPAPIQLQGKGKKVGGINTSRLKWRGATSANIDVYRDGVVIATTPNDGLYDDSTGTTGQASFMYKVCEAATQNCSNTVTVNFGP